jgi:hypothetical protein
MINTLKKTVFAVGLTAAVGLNAVEGRCQSCEQKLAIKQEIQDILAQALALAQSGAVEEIVEKCGCGKPRPPRPSRNSEEQEAIVDGQAIAATDEQDAAIEKCGCGKPRPPRPSGRSDKEQAVPQKEENKEAQADKDLVSALKKALGSIREYMQTPC